MSCPDGKLSVGGGRQGGEVFFPSLPSRFEEVSEVSAVNLLVLFNSHIFFFVGNSFPEICAQMVSTDAWFEDHV